MSRKWEDIIPLLNEYQYTSDTNFKNFPLGTDYSHDYSHDKEAYFMIADSNSQMTISLKAFIKDFSIGFSYEHVDAEPIGGVLLEAKSAAFTYDISLDVPSISVDDAMVNAARMDAIMIMMDKTLPQTSNTESAPRSSGQTDEQKLVLLSNLIHNGNYTKKTAIRNYKELNKYALRCYMQKFSFKPNLEMGFFEYSTFGDSKLFPKVYEVSFNLIVKPQFSIKDSDKSKRVISSFKVDGGIDEREFTKTGTWPFGVSTK